MDKIREWSVPGFILGMWVLVAGYTLASMGETSAKMQNFRVASIAPAAVEMAAPAQKTAPLATKAHKKVARRGPRV